MPQFGEVRVDFVTFTTGVSPSEVNVTTSLSGLVRNPTFSGDVVVKNNLDVEGNITISGTVTGDAAGFTTVTGTTVTGTTANFVTISGTTVTGNVAGFTSVTGTTVTGTTANFVTVSGTTVTGNAAQFITLTGSAAGFTTVTGTTVTGTTANFASGVFTTQVSGATVTGDTGNFTTVTATTTNITSGIFASGTAAAPSVSVGTADNGIYSPGTDQVAVATNGTGRLFIDSSGNVGIGTASPQEKFVVSNGGNEGFEVVPASVSNLNVFYNYNRNTSAYIDSRNLALSHQFWTGSSSSEAMRIDSAGRVGIGTSSPDTILDVRDGNFANNQDFGIQIGTTGGQWKGGLKIKSDGSGNNRLAIDSPSDNSGGTREALSIRVNGNVGIGTTSPAYKFDVQGGTQRILNQGGSSTLEIGLGTTTNQFAHIDLVGDTTYSDYGFRIIRGNTGANATSVMQHRGTGELTIQAQDAAAIAFDTNSLRRLHITSDGNVGIGTSNPGSKVHIQRSAVANAPSRDNALYLENNANCEIQMVGNPVNDCQVRFGTSSNSFKGALEYQLDVNALLAYVNGSERLRINSSGNVGIGTSSPTQKLHVLGSSNDTIDETTGTLKLQASGGNGLLFGTKASSPFESYIQSAFVQDTSVQQYALLLNPLGGNVGIGTSSPQAALDIGNEGDLFLTSSDNTVEEKNEISWRIEDGSEGAFISAFRTAVANAPHDILFGTRDTGGGIGERMRIDSAGRLLVGTSTTVYNTNPVLHVAGARAAMFKSTSGAANETVTTWNDATSGTRYHIIFRDGSSATLQGSITTDGSSTAFNTSSDYRLKENLAEVADGIARLQQLKPRRFNFIVDPDKTVDGFIAHEVQAVVPEAITGEKDAVDNDGNPVYQSIDQSKLMPLLTAALQEAIGRIETLEAKVAALETP